MGFHLEKGEKAPLFVWGHVDGRQIGRPADQQVSLQVNLWTRPVVNVSVLRNPALREATISVKVEGCEAITVTLPCADRPENGG